MTYVRLSKLYWPLTRNADSIIIVPVQNYITAIIIFLAVEMLMTWGFYGMLLSRNGMGAMIELMPLDYENRNGANVGSKVLMIVVAVLNAARNSFSFFLLLIVCMGYGVVKPSLGKTMIYVRWLAAAHFVFGLIYSIASLTITPDSAGMHQTARDIYNQLTLNRTARAVCHTTSCWYIDSILRVDSELSQSHSERSQPT